MVLHTVTDGTLQQILDMVVVGYILAVCFSAAQLVVVALLLAGGIHHPQLILRTRLYPARNLAAPLGNFDHS